MEEKPIRYSDFIGAKIAHVDTSLNIDQIYKTSTTGEWIDKSVKPNKKYYYIFRSIDNHGHFSNPSPVYELEMVYDGYAPFLLRKVYHLGNDAKDNQTPTKDLKKYLYIKPAFAQTVINEEASGLNNLSNPPPTPVAGSQNPLAPPRMSVLDVTLGGTNYRSGRTNIPGFGGGLPAGLGAPNRLLYPLSNKPEHGDWIHLGTEDESLWGKKIKIRVISKITGKRIDINIKYTKKHIEPPKPGSGLLPQTPSGQIVLPPRFGSLP